ncbi:MAG: A/G-specific adenine glycosylase [Acidobacteria bacterium]|nr:A/G-specific adenine glycosylase [Acidobacteriota bacterium]
MPRTNPAPRALQTRLLDWFDRHKRDLPWRRHAARNDPYRIWLVEIMLQQTRVPVAIPYYERFLRAFPTVGKLARAPVEQVLRLWAGLGYYQRARHLHQAAWKIVREHRGRFPRALDEALALPGVGPYTARAVLSIAYRKPAAVVDGNVARVLARVFRLEAADVTTRGRFQELADRLVSPKRPGDFNQALMELGSTLCLPRIPRCGACPLEGLCEARRAGLERTIPRRQRARPRPRLTLSVLALRQDGRLLLVREPGLFSGLWHFPYAPGTTPRRLARSYGAAGVSHIGTLRHQTTMRDLVLRVYAAKARSSAAPMRGKDSRSKKRWVHPEQIQQMAVGASTRRIAALVERV